MFARRKDVMNGRPCVEGTVIQTSLIAGTWRQGLDDEGIRAKFPEITCQQIGVAMQHEDRLDRRIAAHVRSLRHRLAAQRTDS